MKSRRFSGRTSVLAVIVAVCILATSGLVLIISSSQNRDSWARNPWNWLPISSDASHADEDGLGIVLHPEDHVRREPRVINLQWKVTQGFRQPDGVKKLVYLVNDQFPGPTIEARSGDEIVVNVTNSLEHEDVSLHWHGLRLLNQNLMDGAVGITQCPIPPGASFTYRVKIGGDEHGTFWWHGHSTGQRSDGLFGGLIVHEPEGHEKSAVPDYENEILFMIGDWYHGSAQETLAWYMGYEHFGQEPVPDSMIINGKGHFNCTSAMPSRPIECREVEHGDLALIAQGTEKPTKWRIINTGSIAGLTMQVTHANMTPITLDGGHRVAARSGDTVGILYPGERVDLIVEATDTGEPRQLFIALDPENFAYTNPVLQPNQSFPLVRSHAEDDRTSADPQRAVDLASLTAARSVSISTLPAKADQTLVIYAKLQILVKFSNEAKGFINHTSWIPQAMPLVSTNRASWDENQFVPFIPTNSVAAPWVDLVINNLDDGSHPFHMHGHSFYVLSSFMSEDRDGWGSHDPFSEGSPPSGLNLETPLQKDTVSVPRRGHVVIRFRADNAGIWMLHCHMGVHLGSGLAMALHVGKPDDEQHALAAQPSAADHCTKR